MSLYPPYTPTTWKVIASLVGLLFLIGLVLFVAKSCSNWRGNRGINKARANVANAIAAVDAAKGTVANDKVDEAVALENVKRAAYDAITASNATDQEKAEANAAVANYIAAKNANLPTGTTEEDLDKKLRALGE